MFFLAFLFYRPFRPPSRYFRHYLNLVMLWSVYKDFDLIPCVLPLTFSRSALLIPPAGIDNRRVVSRQLRVFLCLGGCNGRSSFLFYSCTVSTSSGTSSSGAFFGGMSFL